MSLYEAIFEWVNAREGKDEERIERADERLRSACEKVEVDSDPDALTAAWMLGVEERGINLGVTEFEGLKAKEYQRGYEARRKEEQDCDGITYKEWVDKWIAKCEAVKPSLKPLDISAREEIKDIVKEVLDKWLGFECPNDEWIIETNAISDRIIERFGVADEQLKEGGNLRGGTAERENPINPPKPLSLSDLPKEKSRYVTVNDDWNDCRIEFIKILKDRGILG